MCHELSTKAPHNSMVVGSVVYVSRTTDFKVFSVCVVYGCRECSVCVTNDVVGVENPWGCRSGRLKGL